MELTCEGSKTNFRKNLPTHSNLLRKINMWPVEASQSSETRDLYKLKRVAASRASTMSQHCSQPAVGSGLDVPVPSPGKLLT